MDVRQLGNSASCAFLNFNANSSQSFNFGYGLSSGRFSYLGRSMYESGIDLSGSAVSSESGKINFSLHFLSRSETETSISGFLSKDQQSGKFSFSYKFPMPVTINGKTQTRQMTASLDIVFDNFREISRKKSKKKEDILTFLHRIIQEILRKLEDKKTNITAVVLDPEDMKEINQISDKKISALISMVIQMVNLTLQARKMANKNKDTKEIVYNPKRLEYEEQEDSINCGFSYSCSLSVSEDKDQDSSPSSDESEQTDS